MQTNHSHQSKLTKIPNRFIPVLKSATLDEVIVTEALLSYHGIACFIPDESVANIYPFYSNALGGIRLLVDIDDVEDANRIMIEFNIGNADDRNKFRNENNYTYRLDEAFFMTRIEDIVAKLVKLLKKFPSIIPVQSYFEIVVGACTTWSRIVISRNKKCPYCESENWYEPNLSREIMALGYLFVSFPIPVKTHKTFCFDCRKYFYLRKEKTFNKKGR